MNAFRSFVLVVSHIVALGACAAAPPPINDVSASGQVQNYSVSSGNRVSSQARHCVALAMYWEARGEGDQGMLAVGSVVLNRVADERFPDSVCGVVYQGGERPPCQFSWWCDGKSDQPKNGALWVSSLGLAEELLTARPQDPTGGALFFHSTAIQPSWRRERTTRIGNHVFYR